jgi:hypothetical protein
MTPERGWRTDAEADANAPPEAVAQGGGGYGGAGRSVGVGLADPTLRIYCRSKLMFLSLSTTTVPSFMTCEAVPSVATHR